MREHDKRIQANDTVRLHRGTRPRYMLWENVCGALTSNKGRDFQKVLTEIIKVSEPNAIDVPLPDTGGHWSKSGYIYDELGGWSVAWRIHDSQYWGVPQRRKRLAVLADFEGLTAADIMFDTQYRRETDGAECDEVEPGIGGESRQEVQSQSEGLPRNLESSGTQRKEVAGATGEGTESTGINGDIAGTLDASYYKGCGERQGIERDVVFYSIGAYNSEGMKSDNPNSGISKTDVARTIDSSGGSPACSQGGVAIVCLNDQGGNQMDVSEDVTMTLRAQEHGYQPIVCLEGNGSRESHQGPGYIESDVMYTLNTIERHAICTEQPLAIEMTSTKNTIVTNGISPTLTARMGTSGNQVNAVCVGNGQLHQMSMNEVANTLDTMHDQQAVLTYGLDRASYNQGVNAQYNFAVEEEKIGTCVAKGPGAVYEGVSSVVRRLTPLECTRLQNFPDGWVDIGDWIDEDGKKHRDADTPKYKSLGNSLALPFWQWIVRRIAAQYERTPTMGGLFSGIGGFELVSYRCGMKPVWSSEIEPFAVAVMKKHFGDEDAGIEGDVYKYMF